VEAFALLMAEGRRVSNLGAVGMLMREEPTVRHALQSMVSYGRLQNEALIHRIEESQGIATIHEELLLDSAGSVHQATELVVAVEVKTMRFFLGADWRPRRICFMHGAPTDVSMHRSVLGQTPEFGSDFNGIVCTSADLDTPIASADPVMAGYIRQQVQTRQQATMTVSDEVRQIVLVLMPRGRCTIDQVARLMGITRRTLHRHLAAENHVFSDLVFAIRRELATRYVSEPGRSLADIAQLLGIADPTTFSRWYRSTLGTSALERRKAVAGA
jgi:AraC-like DNA-binding protein